MAISITRLSGGNTPADGSDPRTFPAIWNATAQTLEDNVGTGGGGSITVSDTAPTDPAPENGDLWWKSDDGKLFVYYNDGDSSQWVDAAGPSVAVQSTAPTGYEGQLWLDDTDGSMYVYYTDPGGGSSQWIGAVSRSGGILQVVSTTKTDTFSASLTVGTDTAITGLSASITPRSTSSKILVSVSIGATTNSTTNSQVGFAVDDGTGFVNIGDADGSRPRVSVSSEMNTVSRGHLSHSFDFLHSPSTISTKTYTVHIVNSRNGTETVYVNRNDNDSNDVNNPRAVSTITLMEVAG